MGIIIPVATNYQSPLTAVPTRWQNESPPEGPSMIPCEIDWGSMGGTAKCVYINVQNNTYANFSQIVALSVDNSNCGADVEFVFPDTAETITIPAYSPKVVVPVFTNQVQFYVSAPNAASEDITRFSIHNVLPPPIALPTTQEQNAAVFNNITAQVTAPGTLQLVPASISGTLETLFATVNAGATAGILIFTLQDGNSTVIAGGQTTALSGGSSVIVLDLQQIRVRFQSGIKFVSSSATLSSGSACSINLYYRTP